MESAARIVNGAILGMDFRTVIVNDKSYVIMPPTIAKLAGAGYYLSCVDGIETVRDMFRSMRDMESSSKALSWLIAGDESLSGELSKGTLDSVLEALEVAFSLVSVENFLRLSALAKNVGRLTAKPRR